MKKEIEHRTNIEYSHVWDDGECLIEIHNGPHTSWIQMYDGKNLCTLSLTHKGNMEVWMEVGKMAGALSALAAKHFDLEMKKIKDAAKTT